MLLILSNLIISCLFVYNLTQCSNLICRTLFHKYLNTKAALVNKELLKVTLIQDYIRCLLRECLTLLVTTDN